MYTNADWSVPYKFHHFCEKHIAKASFCTSWAVAIHVYTYWSSPVEIANWVSRTLLLQCSSDLQQNVSIMISRKNEFENVKDSCTKWCYLWDVTTPSKWVKNSWGHGQWSYGWTRRLWRGSCAKGHSCVEQLNHLQEASFTRFPGLRSPPFQAWE